MNDVEINSFLANRKFGIGGWGEVVCFEDKNNHSHQYFPKRADPQNLLETAFQLSEWLDTSRHLFVKTDHSTCPINNELSVMNFLIHPLPSIVDEKGLLLFQTSVKNSQIALVIYFSILFCWHIHFVSDTSKNGARLSLQDGIVYLIGSQEVIESGLKMLDSK